MAKLAISLVLLALVAVTTANRYGYGYGDTEQYSMGGYQNTGYSKGGYGKGPSPLDGYKDNNGYLKTSSGDNYARTYPGNSGSYSSTSYGNKGPSYRPANKYPNY